MSLRKISRELLGSLESQADASPRRRTHFNFHEGAESLVQRLIVQMRRGTYIRPHRHYDMNKWEMTLALAGEVDVMVFDDDGTVRQRITLAPGGETVALELLPQTWHSYVPRTEHAAFFEIKQGPYDPARITQFAPWAPAEGDAGAADYLRWLNGCAPGMRYPS